jgi:plastocyanin
MVTIVQAKLGALVLALSVLPGQLTASPAGAPGAIEGAVLLAAGLPRPQPRRVSNSTDPEVCGRVKSLGDLLVSEAGGVAHVIVSLTDVPAAEIASTSPPRRVVLDNRDCEFHPHSIVLRAGDTLEMRNSDKTLHTVHLYGPSEENVSLPFQGTSVSRRLTAAGIYQVKCDVHGWMQAFLRVDAHRFHSVTDSQGAFQIPGIPAGRYTLEAWHERLGFHRSPVEIRAGKTTSVELELDNPGALAQD